MSILIGYLLFKEIFDFRLTERQMSNISEVCWCPCFDDAVGVEINEIYNAVI